MDQKVGRTGIQKSISSSPLLGRAARFACDALLARGIGEGIRVQCDAVRMKARKHVERIKRTKVTFPLFGCVAKYLVMASYHVLAPKLHSRGSSPVRLELRIPLSACNFQSH